MKNLTNKKIPIEVDTKVGVYAFGLLVLIVFLLGFAFIAGLQTGERYVVANNMLIPSNESGTYISLDGRTMTIVFDMHDPYENKLAQDTARSIQLYIKQYAK